MTNSPLRAGRKVLKSDPPPFKRIVSKRDNDTSKADKISRQRNALTKILDHKDKNNAWIIKNRSQFFIVLKTAELSICQNRKINIKIVNKEEKINLDVLEKRIFIKGYSPPFFPENSNKPPGKDIYRHVWLP